MECKCQTCLNACSDKPGWFMPGQVEKVAEFLNMKAKDLFKNRIGIDWFEDHGWSLGNVFIFAPAITSMQTGKEYPGDPRGICIFLKKRLCEIHPVKPYECSEFDCKDEHQVIVERHNKVADAWVVEKEQSQVVTLLGREPKAAQFNNGGLVL